MKSKSGNFPDAERQQALADLLSEMRQGEVEIHFDQDAQSYLDFRAKQMGVAPESIYAVAIGDDILIRKEYSENVRVLREEWIHVQQQRRGQASNRIVEAEIEARELMIQNRREWTISNEEIREMISEIRRMRQTSRY